MNSSTTILLPHTFTPSLHDNDYDTDNDSKTTALAIVCLHFPRVVSHSAAELLNDDYRAYESNALLITFLVGVLLDAWASRLSLFFHPLKIVL